jgi:hypothetical protein
MGTPRLRRNEVRLDPPALVHQIVEGLERVEDLDRVGLDLVRDLRQRIRG